MKNFKKALALVLAAATAFTFAPVANLGSAVTAKADTADVQQTLTLPTATYTNKVTTGQAATEQHPGYSGISWARTKNGVVVKDFQVSVKDRPSHVFRVATVPSDVTSYKEEKESAATSKRYFTTAQKAATQATTNPSGNGWYAATSWSGDSVLKENTYLKSESDGILDLGDIYIGSKGSKTIEVVDESAHDGETLRLTINAEGVAEKFPEVTIQPLKYDSDTNPTKIQANGDALTSHTSTYFLSLNKYNPGYLIEYKNNGTYTQSKKTADPEDDTIAQTTGSQNLVYTNWAGETIAVSKIELSGDNRSIAWASDFNQNGTPDTLTNPLQYRRESKITLEAGTDLKYTDANLATGITKTTAKQDNWAIFKTTAATQTTDNIAVTFTGDNKSTVNTAVNFSTDKSENAIDSISIEDVDKTIVGLTETNATFLLQHPEYGDAKWYVHGLDRRVNNSGTLKVVSESSNVTFKSASPSIIDIDEKTGKFTVKNKGVALVQIYTLGSVNNKDKVTTVAFDVNAYSQDAFTVADSANAIYQYQGAGDYLLDMDIPTQAASNRLIEDTLQIQSKGGLKVSYSSDTPSVATVDATTGKITTVGKGTANITATTKTSTVNGEEIWGGHATVKVTVWDLPAVDYDVAPITLGVGEEKVVNPVFKDTKTQFTYSVNYNQASVPTEYELTNPHAAIVTNNTQTSSKVLGKKAGQNSLQVTVIGITGKYRPTTKVVAVNVTDKAAANVITVADDSKSVIMNIGDTKQLSATATLKNTVTFKSNNDAIVTATSGGAITAVSSGSTTITVSADGAESVEIPVIVNAKADNNADITVPGKVAKIKLYQVKGAKLKINYKKIKGVAGYKVVYKYKKNGKQVRKTYVTTAGSKTVSVPKNTSVKVWVRAYNVNAKGQRVNGAYKTATKKTDKK